MQSRKKYWIHEPISRSAKDILRGYSNGPQAYNFAQMTNQMINQLIWIIILIIKWKFLFFMEAKLSLW